MCSSITTIVLSDCIIFVYLCLLNVAEGGAAPGILLQQMLNTVEQLRAPYSADSEGMRLLSVIQSSVNALLQRPVANPPAEEPAGGKSRTMISTPHEHYQPG